MSCLLAEKTVAHSETAINTGPDAQIAVRFDMMPPHSFAAERFGFDTHKAIARESRKARGDIRRRRQCFQALGGDGRWLALAVSPPLPGATVTIHAPV
jgi:hypothetical protein